MTDDERLDKTDSCEQKARDLLERLKHPRAQDLSAGTVVELTNLFNALSDYQRVRDLWDHVTADIEHAKGCPWRAGHDDAPCRCGLALFEQALEKTRRWGRV